MIYFTLEVICDYSNKRKIDIIFIELLRGIKSIQTTQMSVENVTIQYSHHVLNGTIDTKVAQVEFLASEPGPRQICLNATDM